MKTGLKHFAIALILIIAIAFLSLERTPDVKQPPVEEQIVGAATRFYFPSSGAADASPGYSASWEDTSIASRLKMVTTKSSTALTEVDFADSDATDKDILYRQYVSDPIAAQTIGAQTVRASIQGRENNSVSNQFLSWRVYVVSNDGSSVTGTVVAHRRDDTEFTTIEHRSRFDTLTSSAVTANEGDRIVVEIGTGGDPALGSDHDAHLKIGDNAASDLLAADDDSDLDNSWLEFASGITFAGGSPPASSSSTPAVIIFN